MRSRRKKHEVMINSACLQDNVVSKAVLVKYIIPCIQKRNSWCSTASQTYTFLFSCPCIKIWLTLQCIAGLVEATYYRRLGLLQGCSSFSVRFATSTVWILQARTWILGIVSAPSTSLWSCQSPQSTSMDAIYYIYLHKNGIDYRFVFHLSLVSFFLFFNLMR